MDAHRVGRWVDGHAIAAIELGNSRSAVFSSRGDLLAIGLVGGVERLVVYGEGQEELYEFDIDDVEVIGYDPHPLIKAPIAV